MNSTAFARDNAAADRIAAHRARMLAGLQVAWIAARVADEREAAGTVSTP